MKRTSRLKTTLTLGGILLALASVAVFVSLRFRSGAPPIEGVSRRQETVAPGQPGLRPTNFRIGQHRTQLVDSGLALTFTLFNGNPRPGQARVELFWAGSDSTWASSLEFWVPETGVLRPRDSMTVTRTLNLSEIQPPLRMRVTDVRAGAPR